MSPRFTQAVALQKSSPRRWRPRKLDRRLRTRWPRWLRTGDAPRLRIPGRVRRAPRSGSGAIPDGEVALDVVVHVHESKPHTYVTCNLDWAIGFRVVGPPLARCVSEVPPNKRPQNRGRDRGISPAAGRLSMSACRRLLASSKQCGVIFGGAKGIGARRVRRPTH
jgi:hypothetical protein